MDTPFPAYHGPNPFIFVCYAHSDAGLVYPELSWLRDQGLNIWYDEGISAGRNWRAEIGSAIRRAERVVFFISRASLKSDHCSREINFALDEHKPVLPIYLEPVELTTDLQVGLSQVQALHRHSDVRYRSHLIHALRLASTLPEIEATPVSRRLQTVHTSRIGPIALVLAISLAAIGFLWTGGLSDPEASKETVSLVVKPFTDESVDEPELAWEIQRRLSASEGLLVRVDDADTADGDYQLTGNRLGGVISLTLSDRNDVVLSSWSTPMSDDLSSLANSLARSLLIKLGRAAEVVTRFEVDLEPDTFRTYLTASSMIRRSHSKETLDHAEQLFKQVISNEPRYAPALAGLCSTYLKRYLNASEQESFQLAEQYCHRALTLDDQDPEVHIALGMLYRESDQEAKAIDSYHRALTLAPYSTDAMRGLGETYERTGAIEEAERWLHSAIEIEPNHWENYQSLGLLYFSLSRFDQAINNLQAAFALAPEEPTIVNNIGAAKFMTNNFADAASYWERAVARHPHPQLYANIAASYFYDHRFDQAEEMYRRAHAMAPEDHRFIGNIGDVRYVVQAEDASGYFQQAIQLANQELSIDPGDAITLSSLFAYHAALNEKAEAQQFAERAATVAPEDIDVIYALAVGFDRLGRGTAQESCLRGSSGKVIRRRC